MFKFLFKIFKWLAVALLLLGGAAWFYPEKFLTVDSGPAVADVIIVIGGGSHERPLRAAQLFQQHAAARVLITGAGDDGINRQLLLANGGPAPGCRAVAARPFSPGAGGGPAPSSRGGGWPPPPAFFGGQGGSGGGI